MGRAEGKVVGASPATHHEPYSDKLRVDAIVLDVFSSVLLALEPHGHASTA